VDKVWLFNCQKKEISPNLDLMIVSVLDDELLQKPPTLGVKVQFLNRSNFDQEFVNCLKMSVTRELKMKLGLQSASQNGEMPPKMKTDDVDDDDDDDDVVEDIDLENHGYSSFWETDVRKHCLILFTTFFRFRNIIVFALTKLFFIVIILK